MIITSWAVVLAGLAAIAAAKVTIVTAGQQRPKTEHVAPKIEPRKSSRVEVVRTAPIETVAREGW